MPRGDRTGPKGMGARSGRAAGYCTGEGVPGYTNNPAPGCGFDSGPGVLRRRFGCFGRRWRNMFFDTDKPGWNRIDEPGTPYGPPSLYVQSDPKLQKQALKRQADFLRSELEFVNKRIAEFETGDAETKARSSSV